MLTPAQQKFVELERRKDEIKKYYEDLRLAIEDVVKEVGLNGYFQCDQGIVYKMVEPEGKYIVFDKHTYLRTKRAGERAGTLSVKEAAAAGFKVGEPCP